MKLEREYHQLRDQIQQEIALAKAKGRTWTEFREMLPLERIGAARCKPIPKGKHCTGRAKYVSYCTEFDGRVVRCEGCHAERQPCKLIYNRPFRWYNRACS